MNIKKRKDGRYEGRFMVNGKRYYVYAGTQKTCKELLLKKQFEIGDGSGANLENIAVNDYFAKYYIPNKEKKVKESTIVSNKLFYNKHLKEYFGNMKLASITRLQVKDWQAKKAQVASVHCTNRAFFVLHNILKHAVQDGFIEVNPADNVNSLKEDNERKKAVETIHRALTDDEITAFFECAKSTWYYNLYLFMLFSGVRIGEACALKWQDVKEDIIDINKTVTRGKNGIMVNAPKTKTSLRQIPKTGMLEGVLQSQKETCSAVYPDCDFVFPSYQGKMADPHSFCCLIGRIARKANVEYFTSHAFRDTFATKAIESGMNPNTLKVILGHSSISMTMDLYAHVMPNTKAQEMEAVQFF